MVSEKLKVAVFLSGKRNYQIAAEAGVHPSTLSRLLNGVEKVNQDDPRVLKIGEIVGVAPRECFSN